jgi:hypothetical protein
VALLTALLLDCRIAGAISLSGPLPLTVALQPTLQAKETPFMVWRRPDDEACQETAEVMAALGVRYTVAPKEEEAPRRVGLRETVRRTHRLWGSTQVDAVDEFLWG